MPENKSKTVAVFGGSFSPPTIAHEAILRQCAQLPEYDEVWLLPSGNRTDKTISVQPTQQLDMLHILLNDVGAETGSHIKIIDTEIRRGIATETYDTYQEFVTKYPTTKFWFVFGADSYATIGSWLRGSWLLANLPVLLVERHDMVLPPIDRHVRHLAPLLGDMSLVSSSLVRSMVNSKRGLHPFVSPSITRYIDDNKLFSIPAAD